MRQQTITPRDLSIEAERMIEAGEMPSLEDLLNAVEEVREKFADKFSACELQRPKVLS